MARYIWNLALGAAMQPILHVLEVTFRNHIYYNSVKFIDESKLKFRDVDCWLDADPTLLEDKELRAVAEAKETLLRTKKPLTPGRLIAGSASASGSVFANGRTSRVALPDPPCGPRC